MKMEKKFMIVLLAMLILFCIGNLLAVEIKEIWQKQFDETVEDVILGEIETTVQKAQAMGIKRVKGNPADKIKVKIPKVLITKNAIKFIEDNKIKKEIPIGDKVHTYLIDSARLNRIGYYKANIKTHEEKGTGFIESSSLTLLDNDGNELVNRSFKGGYDFIVSDNGRFVALDTGSEAHGSSIYFYDAQGNLIKELEPFGKKGYFASYKGTYSQTDNYFGICFDDPGGAGVTLIIYSSQGDELWRYKISKWSGITQQVLISPKDRYIYIAGVIFVDNTTNKPQYYGYCFDINGKIIISNDIGARGVFSSDGDYIGLSRKNTIELIDIKNNKKLWQCEDSESSFSVNSIDISSNAKYLVSSLRKNPDIENKKILVFNKEGKVVFARDYISKDKSIERISVEIDDDGEKIYLIHGEKLEILDIIK